MQLTKSHFVSLTVWYIHQCLAKKPVLQRFYHQQSQLRERQLEEEGKLHQENTNPFHSDILKYQTIQRSHVPNVGVMNPFHEHQYHYNLHQYNHRGIDDKSHLNQQSANAHQLNANSPKHQYLFSSCSNGKKNSVQPTSSGFYSPGGSDYRGDSTTDYPRLDHNVYSSSPRGRNSPSNLINGSATGDGIKDDSGEFFFL